MKHYAIMAMPLLNNKCHFDDCMHDLFTLGNWQK